MRPSAARIQRADEADAEALVPLQIAAFHDDARLYPDVEIGGPPGYDSIEYVRRLIREDEYYKISYEGRLVGGLSVFQKAEDHYHLDIIFIAPEYHGRGIGSQAMTFILNQYPQVRWTLDTPRYAVRNQHFYGKFGFIKTGEFEADGLVLYSYMR